jgi:hypothetical protein
VPVLKQPAFTSQPQGPVEIDWSNPLTRGLQVAILPQQGDLVSGGGRVRRGSSALIPTRYGMSAWAPYTGTGANDFQFEVTVDAPGDRTFAVYASNVNSIGNNFVTQFLNDGDSLDNLQIGPTSFVATLDNNSAPSITVTQSAIPRLYAGRRQGNLAYASVDSTFSASAGTGTRGLQTRSLYFGRDSNSGINTVDSTTYFALYWARFLSEVELRTLAKNPWQLFRPRSQVLWVSVGSSPDVSVALTGVSSTLAVGTPVEALSYALSGVAGTLAAGTVASASSRALSGVAASLAVGTLTPALSVPLSGTAVTISVGTVTTGSSVTAALTGVSSAVAVGTPVASVVYALSGVAVTVSVGSVVPASSRGLTGVSTTTAVGSVRPALAYALSGVASTLAVGSVSTAGDVVRALTGVSLTVSVGTVTAVSGASITLLSGSFIRYRKLNPP